MARYSAEEMEQVTKALEEYVVYHAGDHDDDCPGDDTCDCSFSRMNDGANHAFRVLKQASQRERAWEQLRAWIADDAHNWSCAACGKNVYTQQLQAEMSRLDAEPEGE